MFLEKGKFLIFGHRGLPLRFTENSLTGFLEARKIGLDGVELDVQLTKDKELIVYHDYILDFHGEKKHPWDLTLSEIKEIELERNERIPLLDEVLRELKGYRVIIELKTVDEKMERVNKGIEQIVAGIVSGYDLRSLLFVSFDPRTLMELKKLNSSLSCGWNVAPETIKLLGKLSPSEIKELGIDYLHPSHDTFADSELSAFIEHKIPVIVWTVNSVDLAGHLRDVGVSGIITDNGTDMVRLLRKKSRQ